MEAKLKIWEVRQIEEYTTEEGKKGEHTTSVLHVDEKDATSFYEYVCSKFSKKYVDSIRENKSRWAFGIREDGNRLDVSLYEVPVW